MNPEFLKIYGEIFAKVLGITGMFLLVDTFKEYLPWPTDVVFKILIGLLLATLSMILLAMFKKREFP